jgi:hypothetical protein
MSDIYKIAAQHGLRFPSMRGELTVEQLFQMPLTSQSGFDLDTVAKAINGKLKGVSEESFVEDAAADPLKQSLMVSLDIVKDVIATKQAANRAALARTQRAAERRKLLDILSAKKDQQLTQASVEELEKKLAELDT